MKRVKMVPREDADDRARRTGVFMIEKTLHNGLIHRTWDENSGYVLTKEEVDVLLKTVSPIIDMSREAVDFLLDGEWGTFGISPHVFNLIRESFDNREPELFTRYDFAYMADETLKLVGIEADAPRFLIETAHTQRAWLLDTFENKVKNRKVTQLNSIPEMTIKAFQHLQKINKNKNIHIFTGSDDRGEDWLTSAYIKGLIHSAGWIPYAARMKGLHWNKETHKWADEKDTQVMSFYKHYPWELLLSSAISKPITEYYNDFNNSFEPAWKMMMSIRAMLPALYYLYPDSEILSPSKLDDHLGLGSDIVVSTILPSVSRNEMGRMKGRDFTSWGENMKNFSNQNTLAYRRLEIPKRYRDTSGGYRFPFISVFTVGGHLSGIGVRESRLPLLGSHTTFKPHAVML